MVNMGLRVLYRPDQHQLPSMYRLLGVDYDERVLPSICNEVKHNHLFPLFTYKNNNKVDHEIFAVKSFIKYVKFL